MNNREFGKLGEELAAYTLRLKGYQVVKTNYANRYGEIDIVCTRGNEIIFVEVKTRNTNFMGSGVEAVTQQKQERIRLVAQCYLDRTKESYKNVSFHVIEIKIDHIPNAF